MLFDQILFVSVSISFRIISSSNKNTPIAELFPKTCLSSKNVKYVRVFMTVLYPNNPKNLAKKDPSQKHIDDSALSKVRILYFKSDLNPPVEGGVSSPIIHSSGVGSQDGAGVA